MRPFLFTLFIVLVNQAFAQQQNLKPQDYQISDIENHLITSSNHFDTQSRSLEVHPELAEIFQNILDSCSSQTGAVALSASVNIPDGIWNGAIGEASQERAVEVTDIFGIGSVTKTITSAAIFKLQEQEMLTLDDSIEDWIPNILDYEFIDPNVKIYQLLQHTSGIFDYTTFPVFTDSVYGGDFTRIWTPIEILENFMDEPVFITGQSWGYSNTNYLLLGLIIEAASGVQYHEYVRENILDPAGLTDIRLFPYEPIASEHAHIYVDFMNDGTMDDIDAAGIAYQSIFSPAWAAGAYTASAEDITTFAKLLYSGQILSQESMDQLFGEYPLNPTTGYGMGVIIYSDEEGVPYLYGHNGAIFYSSNVFYFPAKDLSVSILANSSNVNSNITLPYLVLMIQACIDFVPDTATDVEKILNLGALDIMPNPAQDFLNIQYELNTAVDLDIFVTNAAGQRVAQIQSGKQPAGPGQLTWNGIGQLGKGFYFLEFRGKGISETKVFVKE